MQFHAVPDLHRVWLCLVYICFLHLHTGMYHHLTKLQIIHDAAKPEPDGTLSPIKSNNIMWMDSASMLHDTHNEQSGDSANTESTSVKFQLHVAPIIAKLGFQAPLSGLEGKMIRMMMSFQSLGNLTLALKSSVLVSVRDKSSSYTPRLICCELCFHHIHWSLSSSLEPRLSRCSEIPISAWLKCLNYATNTVSFLLLEYPSMNERMIKSLC